jgi:YesN/AraC family two-component response regulator
VSLKQGNSHFLAADILVVPPDKTPVQANKIMSGGITVPTTALAQAEPINKNFTILVAEDNDDLRLVIKETFELQYHILECQNGSQAWETAIVEIPDLIISDVMMPEMDGFTLCEKLKTDQRTSHIPVILLTAKSTQSDQVSGLETGADLYLTKPYSTRILELNVRNLLASREKLRQRFSSQIAAPALHDDTTGETFTENVSNTVDKEFLQKVLALIEEHMDNPDFGVEMLSRKIAMSAPVLYKKIKAVTDMSVNEFVKSIRLKKAAQLLLKKQMTVYEVAYAVGYSDRKYFSREFKKQFGKTPSEYTGEEIK